MSFQSIVNSIMQKIPVNRLKYLRHELQSVDGGLPLEQFIQAALRNMELDSEEQLLQTIPELMDLFEVIDVNGDGSLEWKEFVGFLIDQVVKMGQLEGVHEKIAAVAHDATGRSFPADVTCCRVYFGKLFVSFGREVHIYSLDALSQTWIADDCATITVEGADVFVDGLEQDHVCIVDFALVDSADVLLMLRSDRVLHSVRFTTRAKLTSDSIFFMGVFQLPMHCSRVEVSELPKEPYRCFLSGAANTVDSWTISVDQAANLVRFSDYQQLEEVHTDMVRDILVVAGIHRLFISASLDRRWAAYDLITLNLRYVRSGVFYGIRCLAHDGRSLLLAGCLDFTIAAWDLDAELDLPLFTLRGHGAGILKIVALRSARCFSLDCKGELRYWDITMNDREDRLLDAKRRPDDRFLSFDVFTGVSTQFDAMNNLVIAGCGRLTHVYKVADTTSVEDPPLQVLFSYPLLTIITVHPNDMFLWNATNAELMHRIADIGQRDGAEILCATLNSKGQKVVLGDSVGTVSIYNAFNGVFISSMAVASGLPVRFLAYTADKLLLLLAGNSELFAVDEQGDFSELSMLRRNRVLDRYVVAMEHSPALGLVALADTTDAVTLFDFELFSLESTYEDVTGSKICALHFLQNFPLLVVANCLGSFVLIPVMRESMRRPLWRIAVETAQYRGDVTKNEHMLTAALAGEALSKKNNVRSLASFVRRRGGLAEAAAEVDESVYRRQLRKSLELPAEDLARIMLAAAAPPESFSVELVVGYEDGKIAVFDLSYAVESTNTRPLAEGEWRSSRPGYDPRRRGDRDTNAFSLQRTALTKAAMKRSERHTVVSLLRMWRAHHAAVLSLVVMRHGKSFLSGSYDRQFRWWTIEGELRGILTRGSKADQVVSRPWQSPIDHETRAREKHELAVVLRNKLHLKTVTFNSQSKGQIRRASVPLNFLTAAHQGNALGGSSFFSSFGPYCEACKFPERLRVIGQLGGAVTYKESVKDKVRALVGTPASQLRASLDRLQIEITAGADKRKRVRRRRRPQRQSGQLQGAEDGSGSGGGLVRLRVKLEDSDYIESIMQTTTLAGSSQHDGSGSLKTRYDAEILRFEARDPHNWELSSNNKQKELYSHLFRELVAKGMSRDQMALLEIKLNILAPGGSFREYVAQLRRAKVAAAPSSAVGGGSVEGELSAMSSSLIATGRAPSPVVPRLRTSEIGKQRPQPRRLAPMAVIKSASLASTGNKAPSRAPMTGETTQGTKSVRKAVTLLPVQMANDVGMNSDLKATYLANHSATEDAYARFTSNLKAADKTYRRVRRDHRRKLRKGGGRAALQLEPINRSSTL